MCWKERSSRDRISKVWEVAMVRRNGWVRFIFKHYSAECRRTGGPSNCTVELDTPFALSHHRCVIPKNPVRNRLYEAAVPKPILGRAYLECAMDATTVHIDDRARELIGLLNRRFYHGCGIAKRSRRYRFEKLTPSRSIRIFGGDQTKLNTKLSDHGTRTGIGSQTK